MFKSYSEVSRLRSSTSGWISACIKISRASSKTVKSIAPKGDNFELQLSLSNNGSQPVNFGQGTTINVINDRSQGIGSSTSGLPNSLAATGKETQLTLTIPKNALDKVKSVSLQLTDVDKKLQLEASGVPIGK